MKKIYVVSVRGDGVIGTFGNKKAAMTKIKNHLNDEKPECLMKGEYECEYASRYGLAMWQLFYLNDQGEW